MILPEKNTIGIYKITSPSGKIYIGQSICIRKRWKSYINNPNNKQYHLYRSFNKYGLDTHNFEIIHYCKVEELNELERYYQDFYDCIGRNGLNCILQKTDAKPYIRSKELNHRMSLKNKGKKMSKESRLKMSKARKGLLSGSKNPAARQIVVKNLDTLEVFEGSMECVAKHIGCDVEYVWNQVDELTKTAMRYKEWIFMDKNKHHDFLDIKGDVYLDLYTGIYHFYESEMMLPTKYSKYDCLSRRLKRTDRYIKT